VQRAAVLRQAEDRLRQLDEDTANERDNLEHDLAQLHDELLAERAARAQASRALRARAVVRTSVCVRACCCAGACLVCTHVRARVSVCVCACACMRTCVRLRARFGIHTCAAECSVRARCGAVHTHCGWCGRAAPLRVRREDGRVRLRGRRGAHGKGEGAPARAHARLRGILLCYITTLHYIMLYSHVILYITTRGAAPAELRPEGSGRHCFDAPPCARDEAKRKRGEKREEKGKERKGKEERKGKKRKRKERKRGRSRPALPSGPSALLGVFPQAEAECEELEAAVATLKAQLGAAEDALHAAEAAAAEVAAAAEARCTGRARARARSVAGLRLRAPARTR
jgi:hypothetical protein